jgi:RNA exonuclease 1
LRNHPEPFEQVQTKEGLVLARISIVDHDLKLVYDTLVQPAGDVIDYATQWSGMTEARLAGATTTLKDVQRKLIELFDYNTILVGHSLDNDLRVLKVSLSSCGFAGPKPS